MMCFTMASFLFLISSLVCVFSLFSLSFFFSHAHTKHLYMLSCLLLCGSNEQYKGSGISNNLITDTHTHTLTRSSCTAMHEWRRLSCSTTEGECYHHEASYPSQGTEDTL